MYIYVHRVGTEKDEQKSLTPPPSTNTSIDVPGSHPSPSGRGVDRWSVFITEERCEGDACVTNRDTLHGQTSVGTPFLQCHPVPRRNGKSCLKV